MRDRNQSFHYCESCDVGLCPLTPVDSCQNTRRKIVPSAHHNEFELKRIDFISFNVAHNEIENLKVNAALGPLCHS